MANAEGESIVDFVVKDVDLALKCTEQFAEKAENGRLIGLHLDVETHKALGGEDQWIKTFDASAHTWTFVSAAGTTFNGSLATMPSFFCLADAETLPFDIGPAQKASGVVVLDVPEAEGTLIFEPYGDGLGWEWEIGVGADA
ncbi:hypothetical protein ACQ7DA_00100 [Zafaria sp. J156]|uniref:hypothetical protein n=1 Tax=Zafaria sp. J156 TaxID=3116490 RepID=UPI002E77BB9B|nr:hypothetical protein [Zafaria sp. J156]MEE1619787.1 hypothetical protein [Zafaria sp. J156]